MSEEFRREIKWEPGYDHRHDADSEKQEYGCHGLSIRFLLHGPKATVQFLLFTHWLPTWKSISDGGGLTGGLTSGSLAPLPADIGYHADAPQYEGHEPFECEIRPAGKCWYDGSSLVADNVFKLLLTDGEEAVWKRLREFYDDHFGEPKLDIDLTDKEPKRGREFI